MKRFVPTLLATAALLGLAACGGGSPSLLPPGGSPGSGPGLSYTNPTGTQGQFALVKDSQLSTSAVLVLDLVGPETSPPTPACGVTFGFDLGNTTQASWSTSPVVTNGTLFTPATGTQPVQGWVNGARLQGIVANKGLAGQVSDIGAAQGVIGKIALTPVASAAGTVVLTDNGLGTVLDNLTGTPYPIQILVGTLTHD